MSANPTRVDWEATTADPGSPLQEGNRVLESIARQETLRALLAFSDLREQIRNRRMATGCASDRDLFETERFILDEVLQLICDRVQAITQADGIVIALAEGSDAEKSQIVCRAAAGPLAIGRGVRLTGESEILQDCLESGRILRCDDCEADARFELDFARQIGARSTVLIPLRGRREQVGVLQAFSTTARAFTDHDVRCFDLFAELVLSALKPEDQDRRIHWLSDVAGEVLQGKAEAPVVADAAVIEHPEEPRVIGVETGLAPSPATAIFSATEQAPPASSIPEEVPELASLAQPGIIPAAFVELTELSVVDEPFAVPFEIPSEILSEKEESATPAQAPPADVLSPAFVPAIVPAISDNLMNPSKLGSDAAPLAAVADNKLAALPKITGVRHWSSSMGSTVVIDMEDQVPYEVHRLMSPERIYFDLHDTVLSPELDGKTMDVGDVSLTRVRVAQPVAGVTRIVLDTKDGSNFSVSMESSPYRLVVELRGREKTLATNNMTPNRPAASAYAAPAPAKSAPVAALAAKASDQPMPARTGKFRIVLDAGHGGWDLGTVGRQGLLEKDLVLDVTQRLGRLLQARLGSEVMFTRSGDTYLPLDQRADFANQTQADLFVSVHANYSSSAASRGVETYYTNLFSAPGAREVEKHDDGTFAKLTPVSLSAGGLHEKIEESRRLAASVQRSLYA